MSLKSIHTVSLNLRSFQEMETAPTKNRIDHEAAGLSFGCHQFRNTITSQGHKTALARFLGANHPHKEREREKKCFSKSSIWGPIDGW